MSIERLRLLRDCDAIIKLQDNITSTFYVKSALIFLICEPLAKVIISILKRKGIHHKGAES
jgi:hypothetical protein